MGVNARDLKNDDTTDAGFDLVLDNISSLSGDVGITKIILGAAGVDGGFVAAGNPFPVSGTVTADAGTGPWPVTDNGGALTVDWNGTAPPIGAGLEATALRVTVASDSTGVLSIDDNGGSLTVDGTITANLGTIGGVATEATLSSLLTSSQLIDDTVHAEAAALSKGVLIALDDGTDAQFAQANASGHLKVDISTDSVGIGGGTQYTEGATDASITGTAILWEDAADTLVTVNASKPLPVDIKSSVALDVSAATVPVNWNGTAPPIGAGLEATALRVTVASDSTGLLSIDDNGGSLTVDNGGTFAVQVDGAALTALQLIDDPVFADDAAFTLASSKVMMSGAIRDDSLSTLTAIEGDAVPLRVSSTGALHVTGGGGGTQYNVDDALGATPTGTLAVAIRDDALSALTPVEGDAIGLRVDANGALWVIPSGTVTVANGGTFAVQVDGAALTALQLIDDPVFADDAAFTLASSKVMMSGAIRDDALTTLTAVEGDAVPLRVSSTGALHVTGGGGGTQYNVDDALGATPTGTLAVAIRDDALSALTPVEGDAIGLRVDANGALWVIPSGTVTVDNGGTFAVQIDGAALTALQLIDDPVFADDAAFTLASSKVMMSGAIRDDALTTLTAVEGDAVPLRVSSTGALHVTGGGGGTQYNVDDLAGASDTGTLALVVRDDALTTVTPGDGDYTQLRVDSSGALWVVLSNTTVDTEFPDAAGIAADDQAAPTTTTVYSFPMYFDGTTYDRMRGDSANGMLVNLGSNNDVVAAGDVAHDAVDSGNPVKVGLKAIAHGSNPTAVAAADRTDWYANRHGIPWVIGGHPNVISREITVLDSDGQQTNASLVGTIASGTKIVLTKCCAVADNANTSDVGCRIGFGTASVPAAALAGTNGIVLSHPGIAAGSGVALGDGSGIIAIGADDEELRVTCDDPVGGSLVITISYYTVES